VDGRGNLTSLAGSTMKASPQFQKKSAAPVTPIPLTTNLFRAQRSPAPATEAIGPVTESTPPSSNQLSRVTPDWNRIFSNSSRPATVQPKLTVGAPNDVYEQEADRVADQVMSMPESASVQREMAPEEEEVQTKPLAATITPLVQRESMPEEEELQTKASENSDIQRMDNLEEEEIQTKPLEGSLQREEAPEEEDLQMKSLGNSSIQRADNLEEEDLQTKPVAGTVQREAMPEEEEALQTKASPTPYTLHPTPSLQREDTAEEELQTKSSPTPHTPHPTPSLENRLNSSKGGGSPLPQDVKGFMESRFRTDFSQVRVHTDSEAVQMNRDLNAQAFTHKQDVYFGAGKAPGKDVLTAHELTHVVQQMDGIQTKNTHDTPNVQPKCPSCKEESFISRKNDVTQIIQRYSVQDGNPDQQSYISSIHQRAYTALNIAYPMTYYGSNNPLVQNAVLKHFKFLTPSINPENGKLWNHVLWALYTMLQGCNSAVYEIEPEQSWYNGLCVENNIAVSLDNIHLCPLWWKIGYSKQTQNFIHEWGHKFGKGVNRVFETYDWEDSYSSLPPEELVKMPDAYAGYISEISSL